MALPKSRGGFTDPLTHKTSGKSYEYRNGFGMTPSAEFVYFFDDFVNDVASNVPAGWDAAIIDAGATITQLETDLFPGGVIAFGSDGTTEGAATYLPKVIELDDKEFFMEVRFQTADADDTDVQFGLTDRTAVVNPEDLWTTTAANVIAFGILDGDATVQMLVDKDNGGTSAVAGSIDLSDATWHTLAIWVTGDSANSRMNVRGYVDGELAITWATETDIPDDLVLSPFIGARTGGDAGHVVYFDYVRFCAVR